MPLILAIEPDRRQANQVNAVVRGRLHADLVLADSAERALAALGNRVPDLILTSAFLSPNDEVVLGEHLRALDGAAAHIQTLTIPVLASSRSGSDSEIGGVLGGVLRRGKAKSSATPEGCDPAVFAAQCSEYLERAEAERQTYVAHNVEERAESTSAAAHGHAAPTPPPQTSGASESTSAKPAGDRKTPAGKRRTEDVVEPMVIDGTAAAATVQEAIARFAAFVNIDEEPTPQTAATPGDATQPIEVEPETPVASDLELSALVEATEDTATTPAAVQASEEPDVYDISGFDADAFAAAVESTATELHTAAKPVATASKAAAAPKEPVKPQSGPKEPIKAQPAPKEPVKAQPAPKEPVKTAPATAAAPMRGTRHAASDKRIAASRPKPVQDEWGFFDPDQAGFAALLAKLEEIEEETPPRAVKAPPNPKKR